MGYLHIKNLYAEQDILLFKECYALEKIHGTSAHVSFSWRENTDVLDIHFFSGENHDGFVRFFNQDELKNNFILLGLPKDRTVTVYGEAYGGKCQKMSETYGKDFKFVAFDVQIGESWLDVPNAEQVVNKLGLEFVDYVKCSTNLADLDKERDKDSTQAIRNGCGPGKMREGVVLRPLIELTKNNGSRLICKHKREEFRETKTARPVVDPSKLEVLKNAELIADEWVTATRLEHVLQKIPSPHDMSLIPTIIRAMHEDVKREGEKEIVWNKDVEKAIGKKTVELFKTRLKNSLTSGN